MRIARAAIVLVLLTLTSNAFAESSDECPFWSGDSGIEWKYQEGPDFGVCIAVRQADGKQLFGVYEGHAASFHPGDAHGAGRGMVGGLAVIWYLPPPDDSATILLQTVLDVPVPGSDRSFESHVWVLPQRRADLAQTFRLLASMHFLHETGGVKSPLPSSQISLISTVPPDKSWLACSKDTECSATALSCRGWIAINRSYESQVQRWYSSANADVLSVVECTGPLTPKPDAVCNLRACQLLK